MVAITIGIFRYRVHLSVGPLRERAGLTEEEGREFAEFHKSLGSVSSRVKSGNCLEVVCIRCLLYCFPS